MGTGLSEGYAVLKGRVVDKRHGSKRNGHYHLRMVDGQDHYRIAVNVWSKEKPSEVLYTIDEDFQHPILEELSALPLGLTKIEGKDAPLGLDFIRDNLFERTAMKPLAYEIPGEDNDLNEALDRVIVRAMEDEAAIVYAFGEPWGPEGKTDKIFGFSPGRGVHNVHMNQGNGGQFAKENGVHQDGALVIELPSMKRWAAVFLAFQSQAWHTNDEDGEPMDALLVSKSSTIVGRGEKRSPFGAVRIIAALVNPQGPDAGRETVTLFNASPRGLSLEGWTLLDGTGKRQALSGELGAGESTRIRLVNPMNLINKGGEVSLLDKGGLKVDGVFYTEKDVEADGWSIVF